MHTSLIVASVLLVVGVNCADNDVEKLNANLFGGLPEDSPYWWMSKGSPFKRAVAAGPPAQQFDFASNPFLRCKLHLNTNYKVIYSYFLFIIVNIIASNS